MGRKEEKMKNIFLSLVALAACSLIGSGLVWAEGFGSPVMDGVVDAVYNAAEASDPAGDGAGNANMDLLDLYVCNDATYWYFCFTINDDINATNWGKYVIYLDIDGVVDSGADSSDAWIRNVRGTNPHLPEYGLYSWVNEAPPYLTTHTQLWAYDNGTETWTQYGNLDGVGLSTGTTSGIEWKIEKSRIMSPDSLWCEVWSTGGNDHDNARDTSNDPADDWNADPDSSWQQMAYIDLSTLVHESSGADTTKPRLEDALAVDWTHVELGFSEAMDTSAFNPGNYTIPGLSVTAAESLGVDGVKLTTTSQTYGVNYTVSVSSVVEDMAGNSIHPDYDEATFTGFGIAQVTFTVIDSVDSVWAPGFQLKGSWDTNTYHAYDPSWGLGFLYEMYDDGTNGDDNPGDHVWKRTLDLVPDGGANTWEWGVTDTGGVWIDGNWQFQVSDTTDQELFYTTQEQANHDVPVVFSVDMTTADSVMWPLLVVGSVAPLSWDFDPANDDTLNDEGYNGDAVAGDTIWSTTITFPMGSSEWVEYKYANGAMDNDLPPYVNRIHITDDDNYGVGNPQIRPTDKFGYFLDVIPKPVDDLTVTLSGGEAKSGTGDLYLEWSHVTLNLNDHPVWVDRYKIYRDTAVDEVGTNLIDSTTGLFYLDTDVVGSTTTHYYYSVTAVSVTKESEDSNPVGEFDATMVNAK
jgi:hypothetical protein